MNKNLNELEVAMKAAAAKYVEAANDRENPSVKKMKELKKVVTSAQDEYNKALEESIYAQWAEEGDPIKTAIRTRTFKGKSVRFKVTDKNLTYMEISDKDLLVSLLELERVIGVQHFSSPSWFDMASNIAWFIASTVNFALGGGDDFAYEVKEAAKEFSFDKGIDLKKESTCINALQQVFDAILLIPEPSKSGKNIIRAEGKAWAYIRESMTRKGGIGEIVIGNTGKMTELILDAMHLALTNGDYSARSDD